MDDASLGGFEGNESQQGQGLAYVLPQSRTTGYFMQLANERAQERRQAAAQAEQQQQKANEEYSQHLYAYTTPKVAQEFSKYLQPQFDDLFQKGVDLHTQTGQDPFVNPDFIRKKNDLIALANNTQELNKHANALVTALSDKSKNYTPESANAVSSALNEYHTNPTAYLNKPFPSLQARQLDLIDAHKFAGQGEKTTDTINGYDVTKPFTTANAAKARVTLSQPEFNPMLQNKYGVNTDVGDVFSVPDMQGRPTHTTDPETLNAVTDHILQNASQPHYASTLQAAGIDPTDPHAKDKLMDLATKNNAGYNRAYGDLTGLLDSDISPQSKRNTSEDRLNISERNADRADARESRIEKALLDKQSGVGSDDGRDEFIDNLTGGETEARSQIIRAAVAKGGRFSPDKNGFTIVVPEKKQVQSLDGDSKPITDSNGAPVFKTQTVDHRYTIPNEKSDAAKITANELLNQLDLFKKRPLYDKKANSYNSKTSSNSSTTHPKVKDDPLNLFN